MGIQPFILCGFLILLVAEELRPPCDISITYSEIHIIASQ